MLEKSDWKGFYLRRLYYYSIPRLLLLLIFPLYY